MTFIALLSTQSSAVNGIANSASTMTTEQVTATLGVAGLVGYFAIPSVLIFTAIISYRYYKRKRKLSNDKKTLDTKNVSETANDKLKSVETTILTVEDNGESISIPVEKMDIEFDKDGSIRCP